MGQTMFLCRLGMVEMGCNTARHVILQNYNHEVTHVMLLLSLSEYLITMLGLHASWRPLEQPTWLIM